MKKKCDKCGGELTPVLNTQDSEMECKLCAMFGASAPPLQRQNPSCWPMTSVAMAVNPSQVRSAIALDKKMGIRGVSYNKRGHVIFADPGARRAFLKAHGKHERGRRGGALSCSTLPTINKYPAELQARLDYWREQERLAGCG